MKSIGKLKNFELYYDTGGTGIGDSEAMSHSHGIIVEYLRDRLSVDLNVLYEQVEFIEANRQMIESMPTYPHLGFAKRVNDELIVKISENIGEAGK